jgi:hypothetical protein
MLADVELRELANHMLDRVKADLGGLPIPVERLPEGDIAKVVSRRRSYFNDDPDRPVFMFCYVAITESESARDAVAKRIER